MQSIQEIRKRTGLSMADFARKLGIPYRTIQDWESGRRKCPEYVIALIDFKVLRDPVFSRNKD